MAILTVRSEDHPQVPSGQVRNRLEDSTMCRTLTISREKRQLNILEMHWGTSNDGEVSRHPSSEEQT
jgi:hypothetical protein